MTTFFQHALDFLILGHVHNCELKLSHIVNVHHICSQRINFVRLTQKRTHNSSDHQRWENPKFTLDARLLKPKLKLTIPHLKYNSKSESHFLKDN